jgi:phosphoribosyl 1,2-cyclic phosphodiesterase
MNERSRLQIKFLGVRGSIATPERENIEFGGNTTCLEVRGQQVAEQSPNQEVVVIDAGTGMRRLGLSLAEEFAGRNLNVHLLLTHFHWDHIQGLPFFIPLFESNNRITVHSGRPPATTRKILEGLMAEPYYPLRFDFFAASTEFAEVGERPSKVGDITVHPFPLHHPQGAWGYRFESGGATIVHASDLEHGHPHLDAVLRDYAQNADVLVYDAQYSPEEYSTTKGRGHSTWLEATRVARDARVKHLILFHHDPSHNDATMRQFVTEARRHFENTDAAREGWVVGV